MRDSRMWGGWRFAGAMAVVSVALCAFWSFGAPALLRDPAWVVPIDGRWTIQSAQWVSSGAIGTVYQANSQFLPLPGFLVVLAPAVALGDHLGLVNWYPLLLPRPSMWLVVAPVFFVSGATSVLGIDYLAGVLDVPQRPRRLVAAAIAVIVVPPTCTWFGHPEDLLALALSAVSLALLVQRRTTGSALALAAAVMMQPWAGLLVPLLVGATPAGRRLRALVHATLLPGSCALLLLSLDWAHASRALILQPMQGDGQHLPWWNVLAHRIVLHEGTAQVIARSGSQIRILSIVVAVSAGWVVARRPEPEVILRAAAAVLLARGVFETQVWPWYVAPAAALLALSAARSLSWRPGMLAALVVYCTPALGYVPHTPVTLPPVLALVLLVAGGVVALGIRRPAPTRASPVAAVDRPAADYPRLGSTL